MRIDSSIIGMESERSYTSVSGRVSRFTITSGRRSLEEGTEADANVSEKEAQTQEKESPAEALRTMLEEMRAKAGNAGFMRIQNADLRNVKEQLSEIRQQCLNYLMEIFFPERNHTKTFTYSTRYSYEETESTSFSTQGTVRCADGREISFQLNLVMSRSFQMYYEENFSYEQVSLCDPLVINLNGNIADLSDQTFYFDLDGDGEQEEINYLAQGSGFLALDKNGDGIIGDGSELFGTRSGNGFADLAEYDTDRNGFIDEGDEIWNRLKIWVMDEEGKQQLYSLAEKGVGAIGLQNERTEFAITDDYNRLKGVIRSTGIFLYENGNVGTVQHLDMAT